MSLEQQLPIKKSEEKLHEYAQQPLTADDIAKIREKLRPHIEEKYRNKKEQDLQAKIQELKEVAVKNCREDGVEIKPEYLDKVVDEYLAEIQTEQPWKKIQQQDVLDKMYHNAEHAVLQLAEVAVSPAVMPTYWKRWYQNEEKNGWLKQGAKLIIGGLWQATTLYVISKVRLFFLPYIATNIIDGLIEWYKYEERKQQKE